MLPKLNLLRPAPYVSRLFASILRKDGELIESYGGM